ncbi:MAG: hypothetical protein WCW56_00655 [Candidatus Paceibacterota bacterium]|jgi:hypothetical protein
MKNNRQKGFNFIPAIVILAVLLALGFGGYYYYSKNNQNQSEDKQIAALEKKIGKLIVLPTGEKPILATIKDAAALSAQQPFFAGAQNGDKLLVYSQARKAFIYSETTGKLVNVGPIVYDQKTGSAISDQVQTTKTTVTKVATTTTKKK